MFVLVAAATGYLMGGFVGAAWAVIVTYGLLILLAVVGA